MDGMKGGVDGEAGSGVGHIENDYLISTLLRNQRKVDHLNGPKAHRPSIYMRLLAIKNHYDAIIEST